jgi:hypothetical protein
MNLLQRLKPEYQKRLRQKSDDHPQLVSELIEVLETEKYVGNLRYNIIIDLQVLLNSPTLNAYTFFDDI